MRPLWLLGMLLYILSQLIGSTLALEYMRAEYVAPLGSTSLVFNFLFARFLVGTPVTHNDIYGTIVVILGVIGIVAFGSINSGLTSETDVAHIIYLWQRGGWLGYFFFMSFSLFSLLIFTSRLDTVLAARTELAAVSFPAPIIHGSGLPVSNSSLTIGAGRKSWFRRIFGLFLAFRYAWDAMITFVTDRLEIWVAPKDDKQVAWTLGIGWACCGGGLAGGCLVFAKAIVKLLSGSLSHENPGNQFGHPAPIFTIILLVITAVLQISCLNRGLKVYDSTLVVPVFYGVYTAVGWLDSLIFNDEVEAYQSWTLFLIFVSIIILIAGVVLLTFKKPEPVIGKIKSNSTPRNRRKRKDAKLERAAEHGNGAGNLDGGDEEQGRGGEDEVLWAVGDDSDDEEEGEDDDVDHHQHPLHQVPKGRVASSVGGSQRRSSRRAVNERTVLVSPEDEGEDEHYMDTSRRRSMDPFRDDERHEMHNVAGGIISHTGRPQR